MLEYPKIQSVFKRNPDTNFKTFINEFSLPEFNYLKHDPWVGTEKIDGTNIRISRAVIGGRTDNAQIPTFLLPILDEIRESLVQSDLPENTILFGEGYGAKIQRGGGNYIPDGQAFALFDVHIGNWQPRDNVEEIAASLNIPVVPVLGTYALTEWVRWIQNGEFAESVLHPGAPNEGVVLKPFTELQSRTGDRLITKLKYADFKGVA